MRTIKGRAQVIHMFTKHDRIKQIAKSMTMSKYLGHIVSADGVSPDPSKIEAVTTWLQPTHSKALQSFFCFLWRLSTLYCKLHSHCLTSDQAHEKLASNAEKQKAGEKPKDLSDRVTAIWGKMGRVLHWDVLQNCTLLHECTHVCFGRSQQNLHTACSSVPVWKALV